MHQLRIPIWLESRIALERAALRRDPVLRGQGVPCGDGAPVLLVPGFLAGDLSLSVMARWLCQLGYRPCRAGIRANVDCSARALERLEAHLERLAERHGRRVTVIGHSRGGSLARVLGVRRPDLVDKVVCLGTPLADPLAVHPVVRAQVEAVAALGSLGLKGLFTRDCFLGDCCAEVRAQATAPFPSGVGFVSIYSTSDGVVDWRACLDAAADQVEVRSSHCGMAVNGEVYTAIGRALAPAEASRRRRPSVRAVRTAQALAA
jgi:pimeloyl-ACP methyl ester carboxylesterase